MLWPRFGERYWTKGVRLCVGPVDKVYSNVVVRVCINYPCISKIRETKHCDQSRCLLYVSPGINGSVAK
jgi:hypothetical protein